MEPTFLFADLSGFTTLFAPAPERYDGAGAER